MDPKEANAIRIADYLEDRMSPEEQKAFIRDLNQDEELRQQYEEDLLMESLFEGPEDEEEDLLFQPADRHIDMIAATLEKQPAEMRVAASHNKAPIRLRPSVWIAAAILVMVAVGILIWIRVRPKGQADPFVKAPVQKQTAPQQTPQQTLPQQVTPDQTVHQSHTPQQKTPQPLPPQTPQPVIPQTVPAQLAKNIAPDSLFRRYYTKYADEEPPVEISNYYAFYRAGNYKEVLSAKESDYLVMGSEDKNEALRQSMTFYKAISYLAVDKTSEALSLFESLLKKVPSGSELYYNVQWYRVLTLLKEGNTDQVVQDVKEVGAASPYRKKAEELQAAIK